MPESVVGGEGRWIFGCVRVILSVCFSSRGKILSFQTASVHASWQGFLVKLEKCLKSVKSPTETRSFLPVHQPQLFLHTLSVPDLRAQIFQLPDFRQASLLNVKEMSASMRPLLLSYVQSESHITDFRLASGSALCTSKPVIFSLLLSSALQSFEPVYQRVSCR